MSISKKEKLVSVLLTFFPHPRMVLQNNNIEMIDTIEEKQNLLKNLGVDFLIIHPFSNDFSRLTPIDFGREHKNWAFSMSILSNSKPFGIETFLKLLLFYKYYLNYL